MIIDKCCSILFNKKSELFAFTLAEVLITLAIIGVVAALTIPSLMKKHQQQEALTGFRKNYSVISQSIAEAVAQNGDVSTWSWGDGSDINAESTYLVNNYFLPYLKVSKICGYVTLPYNSCSMHSIRYLDGVTDLRYSQGYYIVLNDGSALDFVKEHSASYEILSIYIDVNGNKNPNLIGKDVFYLRMQSNSNKLLFYHSDITDRNSLLTDSSWGCNKTATWMAGFFCGNIIQLDGWQIKSDYPW